MFDFDAFKSAYQARQAAPWTAFYASDAEWIEYRFQDPPSQPNRMVGKQAIGAFITRIAAWPVTLTIEDELIAGDRIAFRAWVGLADGRRIVEHVMLTVADGLIVRQVDVEAWD